MDLWVDGSLVGSFNEIEAIKTKLVDWQKANNDRNFYLFEFNGEQYSFVDNWEKFLGEHVKSMVDVKIITASADELLLELIGSTQEYIKSLSGSIENLSVRFYANPDQETWRIMADFIEGLNFIYQAMLLIHRDTFDKERFTVMLSELLQAMENRDTITIADALNYEWKGWLLSVQENYFQQ